jgi:signal transduction histidine kinase
VDVVIKASRSYRPTVGIGMKTGPVMKMTPRMRGHHCAISDTGIGMPEMVQPQALEPFFVTKNLRRTGLRVIQGSLSGDVGMLVIEAGSCGP